MLYFVKMPSPSGPAAALSRISARLRGPESWLSKWWRCHLESDVEWLYDHPGLVRGEFRRESVAHT
jgi:hypothetical protein